ncbi:MAG: hypothetical protein ACI9U2_000449, partial [Bradymonadia bacterium]
MNVYIEPSDRLIAPFNDPPSDALILNRPLSDWRAEALADFTVIDTLRPPCLVISDALFCTAGVLQALAREAGGKNAVIVVAPSRFSTNFLHVQPNVTPVDAGQRFDTLRFVSGGDEPAEEVVFDIEEAPFDLPPPSHDLDAEMVELSMARHPVFELHHWVHILWANQFAGGIELRNTPTWKFVLTGLWAVLRALSINKWKVLGKLNVIGKGCDIHPTAVIEGSTLGKGVTVGAFARILFSTIDDGANIMPGAQIDVSVVGARATVSEQSVLRFSVLYPESIASQYLMQQCVLGRRAVTTSGAYSIDLNFDGHIRVPLDGTLWDCGHAFLGSA